MSSSGSGRTCDYMQHIVLTLMFVYLKLKGHIDWSWWWVLSPIWITLLLSVLLGTIVYLIKNRNK